MSAQALIAAALVGALSGDGSSWISRDVVFERGSLYALSYDATPHGKGVLTGGTTGINMDFTVSAGNTNEARRVFVFPAFSAKAAVRLGTWSMPAGASWRNVELSPVKPSYKTLEGGIELGAGEAVDGNVYRFKRRAFGIQGPYTRPFRGRIGSANFNSTRWRLGPGKGYLYEFSLEGRSFETFEVSVAAVHYTTGSVTVAVSRDGEKWHDVAKVASRNESAGIAPGELLPAKRMFVRVTGDTVCGLQAGFPSVVARIDGRPFRAAGFTRYCDAESGKVVGEVPEPDYYDENWGQALDAETKGFALWTAEEEMRVAPWRGVPSAKTKGVAIAAAANEAEAVQLVVKAGASTVKGVCVSVSGDLVDARGRRLPSSAVDVRQVTYLDIRHVTDRTSSPGLWPEPLEPVPESGIEVPSHENRPFWVRVKVPKGTPAGTYRGALAVRSASESAQVPFSVEVFGFELPDVMTLKTSFGLWLGRVWNYHRAKSAGDRNAVRAAYLRALSESHVTAYHPEAGTASYWRYSLEAEDGREADAVFKFDWAEWDAAIEKALREYNFNSFVFHIPGFTRTAFKDGKPHVFHGRVEGTPAYETLVAKYMGAIEAHMKEKNWTDVGAIYWFDEPEERHYPLIRRGLRAIRKYAPSLRCRITEQPEAALMDVVNLWCPVTKNLHSPAEAECRARGDEFWWYVCMQPRAPYATEFIDHPGTDMRVWMWQTWQEKIKGILVWETTWWTSPSVYPDSLQNPYEDAACWAHTGVGPGVLKYNWGNGDGRFLFPPRECFDGGKSAVLASPNSSMRLEILRDGIEDYEYFAILSRLDPGNGLLTVPSDVSRSLTDFTNRPEPIKRHRRALARAIEAAMKGSEAAAVP